MLTRAVAGEMKKGDGGSVVNIASTRAVMSEKNNEAYAASKGGLLSLTHAMAITYAEFSITINCISPGWICTGDYAKLQISIILSTHQAELVNQKTLHKPACF